MTKPSPEPCLSVVMPCYNERATIEEVVDSVLLDNYGCVADTSGYGSGWFRNDPARYGDNPLMAYWQEFKTERVIWALSGTASSNYDMIRTLAQERATPAIHAAGCR